MFAALFVLIVVGSLFTSGLLFFEVLPASPEVLMIIVGAHAVFAIGFFHAYSKYRALHRLVLEGRGELFDMAILAQIRSSRFRGWKDHYRLRRIQGLQLSGLPAQALKAARGVSLSAVEYPRDASTEVLAAMACSDLELGNVGWARRTLADATESGRGADHPEISAASARLAILDGRPQDAVELLRPLTRIRNFPFTGVLRARNQVWLGEALRSTGDENASLRAFQAAVRSAPRSCWAETARRLQAIGDGY